MNLVYAKSDFFENDDVIRFFRLILIFELRNLEVYDIINFFRATEHYCAMNVYLLSIEYVKRKIFFRKSSSMGNWNLSLCKYITNSDLL